MFAGVVVMVVLLVVALGTYRGRSSGSEAPRQANAGAPLPTPRWPSAASATATASATARPTVAASASTTPPTPSLSVRPTTPSALSPSGSAQPAAAPPVAASPQVSAPPPAAPAVTGRYRAENAFSGGFIGEVKVSNTSRSRQDWEVRLVFSGGRLVTAWVANDRQGTLRQADGGYTYTGGEALAPGASVLLQFHVERASTSPTTCTVNGTDCSGL
ncbi:cellulose binding domain-containing protein [Micromonospora costi]|uniref:cellulose binding domain-containing protein n=1 Tax=Micromonospora costi TaxID=1530042 RepID=UPI001F4E9265|nr:cellulose binding domain-containing protein [Micromonospora costi]